MAQVDYANILNEAWDQHAAETFRRNFPEVPLFHGDISDGCKSKKKPYPAC